MMISCWFLSFTHFPFFTLVFCVVMEASLSSPSFSSPSLHFHDQDKDTAELESEDMTYKKVMLGMDHFLFPLNSSNKLTSSWVSFCLSIDIHFKKLFSTRGASLRKFSSSPKNFTLFTKEEEETEKKTLSTYQCSFLRAHYFLCNFKRKITTKCWCPTTTITTR